MMNGIARAERTITPATAVFVAVMCMIAGFVIGLAVPDLRTEDQRIARSTDSELQDGLDAHRDCMRSGSQTGCRMTVENFRTYHAIKREIERRDNAGST